MSWTCKIDKFLFSKINLDSSDNRTTDENQKRKQEVN